MNVLVVHFVYSTPEIYCTLLLKIIYVFLDLVDINNKNFNFVLS